MAVEYIRYAFIPILFEVYLKKDRLTIRILFKRIFFSVSNLSTICAKANVLPVPALASISLFPGSNGYLLA